MVFLPRKLIAAAVLAVFALPSWAQSEAAGAGASAPAAVAAPATEAATPATARSGPRAQRGEPGYHKQHHYRHHRAMRSDPSAASWQERRAQHHAQLKQQLQLSPAQEGAWTEFTTAMEHAPSHARLGMEGAEQLTTPERIDRMRALRIQHAAEADRRGDAVKAFYAQLNPAQQKTFDGNHSAHRGAHPMMGAGCHGQAMPAAGNGHRGPHGARNAPAAAQ
ncbi:Spy/CpxP family protein refolding chaperone [Giesbergeria anulus]|uniref:LTXXQ motif family protein n=1 Tax=Giesbergeria anulus TaxID=180197 RepID=A0A1H9PSM9_9BURK|nr:Spy/CpxP family protein refolding chaperone [Giesbergeria anulus]SER51241.1 LTXXQ motif family protein [Giesbergeria anulus]